MGLAVLVIFTALAVMGFSFERIIFIIAGIVLIMILAIVIWFKYDQRQPVEKRIGGILGEMRKFLRETLLPLGFQEEHQEGAFYFGVKYTRDSILVVIGHEYREQEYNFQATADSSKTRRVGVPDHEYDVPDYDFSVDKPDFETKETRTKVYQRFKRWLVENQIT